MDKRIKVNINSTNAVAVRSLAKKQNIDMSIMINRLLFKCITDEKFMQIIDDDLEDYVNQKNLDEVRKKNKKKNFCMYWKPNTMRRLHNLCSMDMLSEDKIDFVKTSSLIDDALKEYDCFSDDVKYILKDDKKFILSLNTPNNLLQFLKRYSRYKQLVKGVLNDKDGKTTL